MRLTCDQPGRISSDAGTDSPQRYSTQAENDTTLVLRGRAPAHIHPGTLRPEHPVRYDDGPNPEGMTVDLRVCVLAEGGYVTSGGSTLSVFRAYAVTLLLSARTSYKTVPRQQIRGPAVVRYGDKRISFGLKPGELRTLGPALLRIARRPIDSKRLHPHFTHNATFSAHAASQGFRRQIPGSQNIGCPAGQPELSPAPQHTAERVAHVLPPPPESAARTNRSLPSP